MKWRGATIALVVALAVASCGTDDGSDASASVLRVRGEGCRAANIGTSFVVEPGFVLTNAHVIAGVTSDLEVTAADGTTHEAIVVAFDPIDDLALLEVATVDAAPIALGPATSGPGRLYDARLEGMVDVVPIEVTRLVDIESGDIYDEGTYLRKGMEVAADIGPGTSGAPIVVDGVVVGAVFAEVRDGGFVFATSSSEIVSFLDAPRSILELPLGRCRR